jgi:hypothetical protein
VNAVSDVLAVRAGLGQNARSQAGNRRKLEEPRQHPFGYKKREWGRDRARRGPVVLWRRKKEPRIRASLNEPSWSERLVEWRRGTEALSVRSQSQLPRRKEADPFKL